jgi:Xaa-Pro dipeptidase
MPERQFSDLKPMTGGISPITVDERKGRIEKARRLMGDSGLDAVYLEAGSSLFYFTGVRWGRSERMLAAVIPAKGEIAYVCPAFEEARLRELLILGEDVRAWQEHESPFRLVGGILRDRGIGGGRIGIEESVRFFLFDGIGKEAPQADLVGAEAVTIGCRACKSPAEIALMQRAMDITAAAYKACLPLLAEGMPQEEFRDSARAAHKALGVQGGIDVQFGESTAFPHGSRLPTHLKAGDVVLMDGGCTVEGYHSDISRTIVFGEPTERQREVWDLEKDAQAAAFAAAQVGAACEDVDAAARKVITDAGFGPDYEVPGLPHRTGHGIGLDVHEPHHLVRGNRTPLAPGMCFSNEPMIAIYGEFGVRLEDCMYITEDGARFFTQPSPSIEQPFAQPCRGR